jgi:hypothetical protein
VLKLLGGSAKQYSTTVHDRVDLALVPTAELIAHTA